MICPCCNSNLSDTDNKELSHVAKFFLKIANPVGAIKTVVTGIYSVGKTIYYDFSGISQTDRYLFCNNCKVYFIECCHCGNLNCIGSNIMVSPKKITCSKCHKDYVYATHPDPDVDHGF